MLEAYDKFLFFLFTIILELHTICINNLCFDHFFLVIFIYFAQDRFLAFSPDQHPIVLQIGGNNLDNIAKAIELANPYGYDEINLKCVFDYLLHILSVSVSTITS